MPEKAPAIIFNDEPSLGSPSFLKEGIKVRGIEEIV